MELTQKELEVLSWYIGSNWHAFSVLAEEYIGVNGLHRLAEKLKLEQSSCGTVSMNNTRS